MFVIDSTRLYRSAGSFWSLHQWMVMDVIPEQSKVTVYWQITWMDGVLGILHPFNSISVISG